MQLPLAEKHFVLSAAKSQCLVSVPIQREPSLTTQSEVALSTKHTASAIVTGSLYLSFNAI